MPQGEEALPSSPPAAPAGVTFFAVAVGGLLVAGVLVAVGVGVYWLRARRYQRYTTFEPQHSGLNDVGLRLGELPRSRLSGEGSSGALEDVPLRTPTAHVPGHGGFGSEVSTPTFTLAGANPRTETGVFSAAMRRMNSTDAASLDPAGSGRNASPLGSGLNPSARSGSDQSSD